MAMSALPGDGYFDFLLGISNLASGLMLLLIQREGTSVN